MHKIVCHIDLGSESEETYSSNISPEPRYNRVLLTADGASEENLERPGGYGCTTCLTMLLRERTLIT